LTIQPAVGDRGNRGDNLIELNRKATERAEAVREDLIAWLLENPRATVSQVAKQFGHSLGWAAKETGRLKKMGTLEKNEAHGWHIPDDTPVGEPEANDDPEWEAFRQRAQELGDRGDDETI
jgi:hypothetical protein